MWPPSSCPHESLRAIGWVWGDERLTTSSSLLALKVGVGQGTRLGSLWG